MHIKVTDFKKFIKSRVKVDIETGCWNWQVDGKPVKKYGQCTRYTGSGKKYREGTHRTSYKEFKGLIPEGMFVLHQCDNPPCCNPDHLFLGTHQENMDDMISKNRNKQTTRSMNKITKKRIDAFVKRMGYIHTPYGKFRILKEAAIAEGVTVNVISTYIIKNKPGYYRKKD